MRFRIRVKVGARKSMSSHTVAGPVTGGSERLPARLGQAAALLSCLHARYVRGKVAYLFEYCGHRGNLGCGTSCLFLFSYTWSQRPLPVSGMVLWMERFVIAVPLTFLL